MNIDEIRRKMAAWKRALGTHAETTGVDFNNAEALWHFWEDAPSDIDTLLAEVDRLERMLAQIVPVLEDAIALRYYSDQVAHGVCARIGESIALVGEALAQDKFGPQNEPIPPMQKRDRERRKKKMDRKEAGE